MTVRWSKGCHRRHAGAREWGWTMPQRWDVYRSRQAAAPGRQAWALTPAPAGTGQQTKSPTAADELVPGAWETDGGDVRWNAAVTT
jgi:hypothetical protein